jgi:hypothetical protein
VSLPSSDRSWRGASGGEVELGACRAFARHRGQVLYGGRDLCRLRRAAPLRRRGPGGRLHGEPTLWRPSTTRRLRFRPTTAASGAPGSTMLAELGMADRALSPIHLLGRRGNGPMSPRAADQAVTLLDDLPPDPAGAGADVLYPPTAVTVVVVTHDISSLSVCDRSWCCPRRRPAYLGLPAGAGVPGDRSRRSLHRPRHHRFRRLAHRAHPAAAPIAWASSPTLPPPPGAPTLAPARGPRPVVTAADVERPLHRGAGRGSAQRPPAPAGPHWRPDTAALPCRRVGPPLVTEVGWPRPGIVCSCSSWRHLAGPTMRSRELPMLRRERAPPVAVGHVAQGPGARRAGLTLRGPWPWPPSVRGPGDAVLLGGRASSWWWSQWPAPWPCSSRPSLA